MVKAAQHFKGGDVALDGLDKLHSVGHVGNGVLDAHNIGITAGEFKHHAGRNGVSGAVGIVVDVHLAAHLLRHRAEVAHHVRIGEGKVPRPHHHHAVRALLKGKVGHGNAFLNPHVASADQHLHAAVDVFDGRRNQALAFFNRKMRKLTGTAKYGHTVNTGIDKKIVVLEARLHVDFCFAFQRGKCGRYIFHHNLRIAQLDNERCQVAEYRRDDRHNAAR